MSHSPRSHPEALTLEVDSLLAQLPKGMQAQVLSIKERVRGMSPDGLTVFTRVLREEVVAIINGDLNSFETRVLRIMTSATNDVLYGSKDKIAA